MKYWRVYFGAILLFGGFCISSYTASVIEIISRSDSQKSERIRTWEDWDEIIKEADIGLSKLNLKIGNQEVKLHDISWARNKTVPALNMREIGLALLAYDQTIDHGRGGFLGEIQFAKINQEMEDFVNSRLIDPVSLQEELVDIRVMPRLSGSRLNGFNNIYKSYKPSGYVVVENRFPTYKKVELMQRIRGKIKRVEQIVRTPEKDLYYSPYSPDLYRDFLVQSGRSYQKNEVVSKALDDLRNLGVRSRAYPGKLVADTIKPELLIAIPHIEQSDFGEVLVDPKTIFERVDVILGANKQKAYSFTKSPAEAQGLNQFTSGTYKGIRSSYPTADLIKDFVAGAADHVNVTKATALLIDYNRAEYIPPLKKKAEELQDKMNQLEAKLNNTRNQKSLAKLKNDLASAKTKLQIQRQVIDRIENTSYGMEQDLARYNGKPKWANKALSAHINIGLVGDWAKEPLRTETQEFLVKFRNWLELNQHWQEIHDI
ncbi:MAG: hypothetical protein HYW77_03120 [Parcubacteria group bacterium]|nr:hypothetical protein [Parcubacteria group bacterium]